MDFAQSDSKSGGVSCNLLLYARQSAHSHRTRIIRHSPTDRYNGTHALHFYLKICCVSSFIASKFVQHVGDKTSSTGHFINLEHFLGSTHLNSPYPARRQKELITKTFSLLSGSCKGNPHTKCQKMIILSIDCLSWKL